MVLSREQKQKAYLEAQRILQLGKKWQQLVPGEKRPNFERAAAAVIRKALGHATRGNRHNLDISNKLMAEHAPNEARLVERTLRGGGHDDILHSFREDRRTYKPETVRPRRVPLPSHLDDPEVWLSHDTDLHHAAFENVNTGAFVSHVLDLHPGAPRLVRMDIDTMPFNESTAMEV